jgi:hypothetical protein
VKTHLSLDDLRKVDQMTEAMTHPLEEENRRLREALRRYEDDFCEGWCKENGGTFSDCSGCIARAALAAEPASGETDDWRTPRFHDRDDAPPSPPTQGEEERVLVRLADGETLVERRVSLAWDAALRQRADEAARAEGNETLKEIEIMRVWWSEAGHTDDGEIYGQAIEVVKVLDHIAAAIRARIAP